MNSTLVVCRRELAGYFGTPVAYVFLIIFLMLSGYFTWFPGAMYDSNQADLQTFFMFLPWVFLALIPALSMRMWAEERRIDTIELLLTLPITMGQAVLGKFLAAWCFAALALLLTVTEWLSVNHLGSPDNGVIIASYLGALLLAGGFIAIGSCISAITKKQVIAFVLSLALSLVFILIGFLGEVPFVSALIPDVVMDALRSFSFLTHFSAITRGVIDIRDLVFFISIIAFFLYANTVIVDLKKAD